MSNTTSSRFEENGAQGTLCCTMFSKCELSIARSPRARVGNCADFVDGSIIPDREEPDAVGVAGAGEDRRSRPDLDDPPIFEDCRLIRYLRYCEIVPY